MPNKNNDQLVSTKDKNCKDLGKTINQGSAYDKATVTAPTHDSQWERNQTPNTDLVTQLVWTIDNNIQSIQQNIDEAPIQTKAEETPNYDKNETDTWRSTRVRFRPQVLTYCWSGAKYHLKI